MKDTNVLVSDIQQLLDSTDPDAPMLISLAVQAWLEYRGNVTQLLSALRDNGFTFAVSDNLLRLHTEQGTLRIPLSQIGVIDE